MALLENIMTYGFWPIMILSPAVWLTCVRTPAGVEVDRDQIARLTRWVWISTLLAIALYVTLLILWAGFPKPMMLGAIAPAFTLTLRALPLKNPDWGPHDPNVNTRTASLVNRRPTMPVTRAWWLLAWVAALGLLIAAASRGLFAFEVLPDRNERVMWYWAMFMTAFGPFMVASAMWAVAKTREEPEPRDAANDQRLEESYASLRNFRAWCFYWLFAITMPVGFSGFGVVMAWAPVSANLGGALGMGGGILGSVIGIAGAVFGTVAGLRRVRINRELRELQANDRQAAV